MLLDEDGLFSVVMPVCEGALLTDLCLLGGLFLRRRTWVFPMRRSAQPKRVLMTFSSARGGEMGSSGQNMSSWRCLLYRFV